jgi:2'-5' RNA ligase
MRIFVALDIDDEIRERIARFIAEMRALAPDVRWVASASLHVTLKFIGEKPDEVVNQVQERLSSISATGFDLSFRGCGFFPTANPRACFGSESNPLQN